MGKWKDIPGYEGLYQASNTGIIRSINSKITINSKGTIRHWKTRILKPKKRKRKTGAYDPRVDLWKNGQHKSFLVSRLVAMTWCKGYKNNLTVNHIDGNTLNNCSNNLEWITMQENIKKGRESGLYDNAQKQCILKLKGDTSSEKLIFTSQYKASIFLGYCEKYINNRLRNNKTNAFSKDGTEYEICSF